MKPLILTPAYWNSWKQTAKDYGSGIKRGVLKTFDPRTYLKAQQANIAAQQERGERFKQGDFSDPPEEVGMEGVRNTGRALATLSDPGTGGEATGALLTGAAMPYAAVPAKWALKRGSLKLMQSALKPTQSLVNLRKGAGFPTKEAVTEAVLDEGRVMSRGSLEKAQTALDATDTAAGQRLQAGAGQGVTVDPMKVADAIHAQGNPGTTVGPNRFGLQINAPADVAAVQNVRGNFLDNPFVSDPVGGPGPMDPVLAHKMASNTGTNLKGKFGELGSATVEAEKAGRANISEQLRAKIPELEDLWSQEARQITTRDALEAAIARRGNTDPIGLTGIAGAVGSPSLAALAAVDRSGWLKSLGAQSLFKGRKLLDPTAQALRAAVLARLRGSEPPENQ